MITRTMARFCCAYKGTCTSQHGAPASRFFDLQSGDHHPVMQVGIHATATQLPTTCATPSLCAPHALGAQTSPPHTPSTRRKPHAMAQQEASPHQQQPHIPTASTTLWYKPCMVQPLTAGGEHYRVHVKPQAHQSLAA
jgi:hypothetical protein